MTILKRATKLVLMLLPGCYVVRDGQPQEYAAPQGETILEVSPEVDEVNYVVYREYFGCTEAEIAYFPHYRRYYGLTDDDIYFIYFTSRQCGVSFDVCFHSYYFDCGRDYDRLVTYYRVPRERYFVAIEAGVSPPPMYARTYASYRNGSAASVTFTNQEYVALVHMKVGVEYQGQPPATYFSRVQATGSTSRVIVENRDQSGRGGRTSTGAKVAATVPRPWTMPPQQKQQWHQERQVSAAKSEVTFKEVHQEQVKKVEKAQPAQRSVEQKSTRDIPPPKAEGQGAREPNPKHQDPEGRGPRQTENPPPKPPQHEIPPPKPPPHEIPPPKPPQHDPQEKSKGEEKGEKKDKN
jgi:hypothetical protein